MPQSNRRGDPEYVTVYIYIYICCVVALYMCVTLHLISHFISFSILFQSCSSSILLRIAGSDSVQYNIVVLNSKSSWLELISKSIHHTMHGDEILFTTTPFQV